MYAVPDPHDIPSSSLRFPKAVDVAWQFARTVSRGHGLLQAAPSGEIFQQVALDGPFTIDHATGWALGFAANHPGCGTSLVLLSAMRETESEAGQLVLACIEFEHSQAWLGAQGIELHDWFVTNGSVVRSLAFTADPITAWHGEPAAVSAPQRDREDPGLVW